jgi:hypothetical protein
MGGVTMGLLKVFPRLKAIIQDLPDAVRNGEKVIISSPFLLARFSNIDVQWFQETLPDAVVSGRIKFEGDFENHFLPTEV